MEFACILITAVQFWSAQLQKGHSRAGKGWENKDEQRYVITATWGITEICRIEEMGRQGWLVDVCKISNVKTAARHLFTLCSNTRIKRQTQTRGRHSSHRSANPIEPLTDCQRAHAGSKRDKVVHWGLLQLQRHIWLRTEKY